MKTKVFICKSQLLPNWYTAAWHSDKYHQAGEDNLDTLLDYISQNESNYTIIPINFNYPTI